MTTNTSEIATRARDARTALADLIATIAKAEEIAEETGWSDEKDEIIGDALAEVTRGCEWLAWGLRNAPRASR